MGNISDPTVEALAAWLRPALDLAPRADPPPITSAMVDFAQHRHRVAPLLHLANGHAPARPADEAASGRLANIYRANARQMLGQKAATSKLTALLGDHGICSIAIKGPYLGEQLYGDAGARHSKDVDILIAAADATAATRLLHDADYAHLFNPGRWRPRWPLWRMRILKDTSYRDPGFGRTVELHQRLFPIEPATLTPAFIDAMRGAPIASIANDHYVFYLILHGAMAYWPRLKWVADLSALVRRVDDDRVAELRALAREYRCEPAITASLSLVEEVFPGSLCGAWRAWADDVAGASTKRLFAAYRKSLCGADRAHPSQPARKDSFPTASWHIFDGAIARPAILARRTAMAALTQFERVVR